MYNHSANLRVKYCYPLILLALFLWNSRRMCVPVQEPSLREETVSMETVKSPVPEMAVPDGYVESIPPLPKKGYLLQELAKDVYFFLERRLQQHVHRDNGRGHPHRSHSRCRSHC